MPPRRRREAGLRARLIEERLPIPPPLAGDLGEQQTPHPPLRDHQPVPADLDLFVFNEVSPGAPFWLPNGWTMVR